jgi:ribonuclease P protein component
VAYALGRSTGGAVARNLVRRRLREIVRTHEATLPAAWILVGANASAVNMTFAELTSHTQALFSRVQAKVTSESPVSEPAASSQAPL